MTEEEAFKLLMECSARDNRQVSRPHAVVWAEDLHDIPFQDAREAARAHYREKPGVWLLPGHIIAGAKAIRRERQRRERNLAARLGIPYLEMSAAEIHAALAERGMLEAAK